MKDIKVLHVFKQMNRGGAESLIMNVFRHIKNENIKFYFLVSEKEEGAFDNEITTKLGGEIHYIEFNSNILKYRSDLEKIINEIKPDVVHSHIFTFSGIVLQIAKKCNVPIRIAHSHTTGTSKKTFLRQLYNFSMKRLINFSATQLIACSNEASNALFLKRTKIPTKIVKNAIEIEKYSPCTPNLSTINKVIGISDNDIILGHVGSFRKVKNHTRLIDIFKDFHNKNENSHLILVGDGPEKENIINKVNTLNLQNNVHFLGVREDVHQLLKDFDLFLFPSLYEGLGLTLIEAQAAGTKCITTIGVPKEADIGLNMVEFLSLEISNSEWVEVIEGYLNAPLIHEWKERRETIIRRGYSIENTVQELEKIYELNG